MVQETKGEAAYLVVRNEDGLMAIAQMGALEIHVWGAREDRIEQPDRVVFDLDPDPSTPWRDVIDGALEVRRRLDELGLESFVKTTGGKGLHVVAPIRRGPTWKDVKEFSTGLSASLVRDQPERWTTQLAKARRGGRMFIDALRNGRGATWVAPWSPRASADAPVSTPIPWSEVTRRLAPERFTVTNLLGRTAWIERDPWAGMKSCVQSLPASRASSVRATDSR